MIKVITDTTASFTFEEYARYGLTAVPLYIRSGDISQKELFEISYGNFYQNQRLGVKYSTAQPDPHTFYETFRPIIEAGDEIICLVLSSAISGAINSAHVAKEMLTTDKISIIDSYHSGTGLGMLAVKAVQLAAQGCSREEIVQALEGQRSRTRIYFIVESLRYLYEGGRLNGAQALIGSLIQIKPIIWFDPSGKMTAFEKIRTLKAAKSRVLDLLRKRVSLEIEHASLHYGDNYSEAVEYAQAMETLLGVAVSLCQVSPVIAAHTGPDVLGPCVITKK
jgi:DegV family protein with EDD domain